MMISSASPVYYFNAKLNISIKLISTNLWSLLDNNFLIFPLLPFNLYFWTSSSIWSFPSLVGAYIYIYIALIIH